MKIAPFSVIRNRLLNKEAISQQMNRIPRHFSSFRSASYSSIIFSTFLC